MHWTRLLLAVDGSEESRRATEAARDMAVKLQLPAVVVHAYRPTPVHLGATYMPHVEQQRQEQAEKIVGEAVETLRASGVRVRGFVYEGDPVDAILRTTESEACDLIVIGARGVGRVRALLGSVSQRVVQEARVDVLVVRCATPT